MINAYPKNTDPVKQFLSSIGVANVDAAGQATGTTGGNTFMWQDQQAQYQKLLAAQQPQQQSNAFLDPAQPQPAAPAPMAGNSFLSPVGDVRFNGLTPAGAPSGGQWINKMPGATPGRVYSQPSGGTPSMRVPGGATDMRVPTSNYDAAIAAAGTTPGGNGYASVSDTPMLGRDYGVPAGGTPGSVGGFGALAKEISLADGPVARNGALFEYGGAGKGFSITQDPNTVPAQGGPSATTGFTPEAAAIAYQGLSGGMDRNAFLTNLTAGKFDPAVPTNVVLTPMEQAAKVRENAQLREQALVAFDRVANSGISKAPGQDSGVRQNRDNAFMSMLGLDQQQLAATGETVNKRVAAANKVREEGKEREMAPTELFKLYQERKAFQEAGNDAMVKTYDQRIEKMVTSSGVADFFKAMAEMGGKGGAAAVNAPVPAPGDDIPTLTADEAAKLKPGTKFKTTNGEIRIRQ